MMNMYAKLGIAVGLAVAIGAVVILKQSGASPCCPTCLPAVTQEPPANVAAAVEASPTNTAPLPKMIELGSTTCVPCKMMKPILDELTAAYKDKLRIAFVDVHKNPQEAERYQVRVIPTQVFLSADGKELFRHEGFFPKEDILAKWKELGYEF